MERFDLLLVTIETDRRERDRQQDQVLHLSPFDTQRGQVDLVQARIDQNETVRATPSRDRDRTQLVG